MKIMAPEKIMPPQRTKEKIIPPAGEVGLVRFIFLFDDN